MRERVKKAFDEKCREQDWLLDGVDVSILAEVFNAGQIERLVIWRGR